MRQLRSRTAFCVYAGLVWIAGSSSAQVPFSTTNGGSAGDRFGLSVGKAGDVDGDGVGDVIVGAPFDDNNGTDSGSVSVVSGMSGVVLFFVNGDSAGDQAGRSVSILGDVNLDGFVDLAFGAPFDDNAGTDSGSARAFSGVSGATLWTANGSASSDHFGIAISVAGDFDQNGVPDLLVGTSPTNPISGYVRVVSGSGVTLLQLPNPGAGFGRAVDGGGDWNFDGFVDLAVGATNAVDIRSGATSASLFSAVGDSAGDDFGRSVAFATDVDGDGVPDLIVGAPLDDNLGADSGSVRVFSGLTGSAIYTLNGIAAGDEFGTSVDAVADVDQDGLSDPVAGAPFFDGNGVDSGGYRVHSGVTGSTLYSVSGLAAGDHFGASVASAGAVNADVYDDVVAGAPDSDVGGADSGSSVVSTGICYPTTFHGAGCPDSLGNTPVLQFTGCTCAQLASQLVFSGGAPNGIAFIVVGLARTTIPINPTCNLLVQPPFVGILALALNVSGDAVVPIVTPPVLPYVPVRVSLQGLTLEPTTQKVVVTKEAKLCL